MKKIFIVFCTLLFQFAVFAQAPEMNFRNLHKYWEFKKELHDKFVVLDRGGDGMGNYLTDEFRFEKSGFSIPATRYYQFFNDPWRVNAPGLGFSEEPPSQFGQLLEDNNLENGNGILFWGDGTLNLGNYIGVLATEYALLSQNSQSVQAASTLEELYLALQAYRRLDILANRLEEERAIRAGITCPIESLQFDGYSGWFLRTDEHSKLWEEFNDSEINGTVGLYSSRDRNIFHNYDHPDENFRKQLEDILPSQDQIIHLLFGLALTKRYIPETADVNGENIMDIVRNIAEALVFGNRKTRVKHLITAHGPKFPCEDRALTIEDRGTEFFNYIGMLYAHSYITDTPVQLDQASNGEKLIWKEQAELWFNMVGYSFQFTLGNALFFIGDLFIDFLEDIVVGNYNQLDGNLNDNLTMYLALSAAGNPVQGIPVGSNDFLHQHLSTMMGLGTQGKYIYPLAMLHMHYSDDVEFWNGESPLKRGLNNLLNQAPCGGPCTPCYTCLSLDQLPGGCQTAGTEWQSPNRFIRSPTETNPSFAWGSGTGTSAGIGSQYTGLDYMLGYNLFHLTYLNGMIPYFNTYEPENNVELKYVDNNNYPSQMSMSYDVFNGPTIEVHITERPQHTKGEPLTVISESIESNAHVNIDVELACLDFNSPPGNFVYCGDGSNPNLPEILLANGGLIYKADRIILNDGFRVEEGAVFIAETTVGESVACLPDGTFGRNASNEHEPLQNDLEIKYELPRSMDIGNESDQGKLKDYSFKAYPNPFSNNLTIEYLLPERQNVQISLFNIAGQEIKKIVNSSSKDAGNYQENLSAVGLANGIYFVKMILKNKIITEKVTLLQQ